VAREAEKLAADLGDVPRLARVYTYLINYHYLKGDTTQAIEYGQRCLDVGRAIGDPALQGLARQYMGQSYHAQGDYARAERALRENIEATAGDQATISYVASCGWLAFVRMGHVHEGLRLLEDGVAVSRELGIRAYLAAWLVNLAEGYLSDDQPARAFETAREALDMAREHGERGHETQALQVLGHIA